MKKSISLVIIAVLSTLLFFSCAKSPKKKIIGTWKVEDVQFNSKEPMNPAQAEASRNSAKTVSYELLEDKSAKVHIGKNILEGTWTFKEAESGVYMAFKGSVDTVLLGRFEEGKLVNVANRNDMVITTIFSKE